MNNGGRGGNLALQVNLEQQRGPLGGTVAMRDEQPCA